MFVLSGILYDEVSNTSYDDGKDSLNYITIDEHLLSVIMN